MLHQILLLETEDITSRIRVIRFGSKGLSRWKRSDGPTKLEMLGMVNSIMHWAQYLRGNTFYVECDRKALAPLYNNPLKGALYDRWLTLKQQLNFEIKYKCARKMSVADALSRITLLSTSTPLTSTKRKMCFPYVQETAGSKTGINFGNLFEQRNAIATTNKADILRTSVSPFTS